MTTGQLEGKFSSTAILLVYPSLSSGPRIYAAVAAIPLLRAEDPSKNATTACSGIRGKVTSPNEMFLHFVYIHTSNTSTATIRMRMKKRKWEDEDKMLAGPYVPPLLTAGWRSMPYELQSIFLGDSTAEIIWFATLDNEEKEKDECEDEQEEEELEERREGEKEEEDEDEELLKEM